jgi:hemerythrin-like metal-binding protein
MSDSDTIQWSDAMLNGVAEIDQQHRILVDTLIEATIKLKGGTSGPLFDQITRDLLAYAIYHFNTEEQLMREYGYADAAPEDAKMHLAEHRRFSQRVVALRTEAREGSQDSRDALLTFLKDWLTNHILGIDKHLGQFICAARAGLQAR